MLTTILQIMVNDSISEPANTIANESALDIAMKGGWVMAVLAVLLVIGVYIFFERYSALKKATKVDVNFMNSIKDFIINGDISAANSLCKATSSPTARMIQKGISRLGRPLNDINASIENTGNLEISKLEKNLPTLATISGGAPMIGFLGTVIGMIQAFKKMASAGANIDVSKLSEGIYTAMVTTVGGLVVGIIAYFAYNYLVTRVDKAVHNMEATTTEFMDLLNEPAS